MMETSCWQWTSNQCLRAELLRTRMHMHLVTTTLSMRPIHHCWQSGSILTEATEWSPDCLARCPGGTVQRRTDVDETAVVLETLESAALGQLLLVLLLDLGCVSAHLTGASQGSVNLSCSTGRP